MTRGGTRRLLLTHFGHRALVPHPQILRISTRAAHSKAKKKNRL
jgi:hypothetical protein